MNIDPNREYLPSEVAKLGLLVSERKQPYTQYSISRLCQKGILKAKQVDVVGQRRIWKILGADIIEFQKNYKRKPRGGKRTPAPVQPQY